MGAPFTSKVALATGASRGIGRAIADVVTFLASEQGRWLTGQNLPVDGGARA